MEKPLQVTFRDVPKSPAIEELIGKKVDKLHDVYKKIISCHVAVERPQKHQKTGSPYRVRVEVRVPPGHDVIASREPGEGDMHEELHSVVRDVFDTARRRLQELNEKQRGETKRHVEPDTVGVISELVRESDYGFLTTQDGHQIYFHRNSVVNKDFDDLDIGATVRYEPRMGEKGLQASSVHVLDPRGIEKGPGR